MQLRFATTADVAGIHAIYAPIVEHTAISFEAVPPTHAELATRLAETMPLYPWIVAADDGDVLGYAYGHRFAERSHLHVQRLEPVQHAQGPLGGQGPAHLDPARVRHR